MKREWVAIIYSEGEKVNSRMFHSDEEEVVRLEALRWATKLYGEEVDWSWHEVNKS